MKRSVAIVTLVLTLCPAAQGALARRDVGPNTSAAYEKECGGCHFPYQPAWLPERSWRRLMSSLGQHFGENARLKPDEHAAVLAYLVAGSADRADNQRSREILAAIPPNSSPVSITTVLYVGGIHGGFLDPAFAGKPEVKTLAQCPVCHEKAERGWFVPVTYTVSDESFRSNDLDLSASMPVPSFLRPKK
jgi:hypothetical protein